MINPIAQREPAIGESFPGFSGRYRSGSIRAKVAIALLAVTGLVSLVTAFHDVAGFDLIQRAQSGTLTSLEATDFDATTTTLAGAFLVAFVATAVGFLAWLSRTVDNMPQLTGSAPPVTPRWSIGWWFVPFANLVKPYQVVRDANLWMARDQRAASGTIVLIWWLVWITSGLAGTIVSRLPEPTTLDGLSGWFTANLVVDAIGVASAVLAILVVRQIQGRADRLSAAPRAALASPDAQAKLPPCPRCGLARQPGTQLCPTCGFDFWAAYDQAQAAVTDRSESPS